MIDHYARLVSDLETSGYAIVKAYKRKYGSRSEAARAAANARWGNKGSTSTPTVTAEPKPEITKETDKVLREFAKAGYGQNEGVTGKNKNRLFVGVNEENMIVTDMYNMEVFPRSDPRAKALLAYKPEGTSSYAVKIGKSGKVGLHPDPASADILPGAIDSIGKNAKYAIEGFKPVTRVEGQKKDYVSTQFKNPKSGQTETVFLGKDQYDGILASQPAGTELKVSVMDYNSRVGAVVAYRDGQRVAAVMPMGPNFDPATGDIKKILTVRSMRAALR